MSTRESGNRVTYARNTRRRKRSLNVDLNVLPPAENRDQEGTAADAESQGGPVQQGGSIPPPIDVEAFDDDVIISSPRAFAEAKNKVGRPRRRAILVDLDLEGPSSRANSIKNSSGSANQSIIEGNIYINLEGNASSVREYVKSVQAPVPPPPPPPKELKFTCPVCMGPLEEEMSTKCGHIFCKKCIKAAIAAQHKCPTCRRKITNIKDVIRIYLPPTN